MKVLDLTSNIWTTGTECAIYRTILSRKDTDYVFDGEQDIAFRMAEVL